MAMHSLDTLGVFTDFPSLLMYIEHLSTRQKLQIWAEHVCIRNQIHTAKDSSDFNLIAFSIDFFFF